MKRLWEKTSNGVFTCSRDSSSSGITRAREGNQFVKRFPWSVLRDSRSEIVTRCIDIERVTRLTPVSPPVSVTTSSSEVCLRQRWIHAEPWRSHRDPESAIRAFAEACSEMNAAGLVHGDISRNNVIFDGTRLWLVDFEPSVSQCRYGRRVVISAAPRMWLPSTDGGRPSVDSDKIGFYLTLCHLVGVRSALARAVQEKSRESWSALLPLIQESVVSRSYLEIANFVIAGQ